MRILLFGRDGQVGTHLTRSLGEVGDVVALGRDDVDLRDLAGIERRITAERPGLVVNAAAYTAVDRAESEPEIAHAVNAKAPGAMGAASRRVGAALVHYSTDYVFDGGAVEPYAESAVPAPLGVYGRSKLEGEAAVRAATPRHLILRTSWVYSRYGHNFLRTILRLAGEREELRIVDDQWGSPTSAAEIAAATAQVVRGWLRDPALCDANAGIYHMSASGVTTWCRFAAAIVAQARLDTRVVPIPTSQYPTPAARPRYSVLSNAKLARVFGVRLGPWEEGLRRCLAAVA